MNKLLLYLLESGIGLLVFYLFYFLLLKRETGFLYNRFYLLITPVLAFILPLLELPFLQRPELTIFVAEPLAPITIMAASAETARSIFSWQLLLKIVYVAGACFFLYRLLRQLYSLNLFARKTRKNTFYWQNIPVHKTHGTQPTFSFLNCIFWDNSQSLTAHEIDQILTHEAVHVRQKHTLDILYLEVLKGIFWFNPVLYLYQKALMDTHEYIADKAVLQTTDQQSYAGLLVKQLFQRLEFSIGNYFNKSLTLKRMNMLKQTNRRPNKLKQLLTFPMLSLMVLLLSSGNISKKKIADRPVIKSKQTASLSQNEPVFTEVEQAPVYRGGIEKMYQFLGSNIKYPAVARKANVEGNVVAKFQITKTGKIKDVKIVKSLSPETDAEAKRVISLMPDWEPGKQNNQPVNVEYTLPIRFSLGTDQQKKKAPPAKTGYTNWAHPLQDRC